MDEKARDIMPPPLGDAGSRPHVAKPTEKINHVTRNLRHVVVYACNGEVKIASDVRRRSRRWRATSKAKAVSQVSTRRDDMIQGYRPLTMYCYPPLLAKRPT